MRLKINGFGKIIKTTFKSWNAADPFRQSSIIAYYAIFSIPALLVLVINIAGLFFEKQKLNGELSRQIESAMGHDTAQQVQSMMEKAGATQEGLFANIMGIIAIIFGAMGVFVELQKSLNSVWEVKQKPNLGFMNIVKERVFSFGLIISIGFLLLISLLVSSALAAASHKLEASFSGAVAYLFYALEFAVSLGVISVLFALMFKVLPDVKMKWRNVWIGAGLTAILFTMGKYAISFYFGKAQPASVYGAAGSVILILLWVSYSSMIVFFGAEFTKQYALYHGIEIVPDKNAVIAGPGADTDAPGSPKPLQTENQQGKTNNPVKPDPRT